MFLGCSSFLGVFQVFWVCSRFFGGVPGFSGVPECSVMFRCSGVPVFLEVLHANRNNLKDPRHEAFNCDTIAVLFFNETTLKSSRLSDRTLL